MNYLEKKTESEEEYNQRMRTYREKHSIPRQLQLLFARLQMKNQRAVKTTHLTFSFGWTESESFTQHDVQELCRVLFDALEAVLKNTEQENLINDLYQGQMKDYVCCEKCKNESSKNDTYLDIPLVLKGFGEKEPVKGLLAAMDKFVKPEILNEDNQYLCEKCNIKVDATKGLQFLSFPYLLTLQLKRFDFDYESFKRIKLNSYFEFPFFLSLDKFLKTEKEEISNEKKANTAVDEKPQSSSDSPKEIDSKKEISDDDDGKEEENGHIENNTTKSSKK